MLVLIHVDIFLAVLKMADTMSYFRAIEKVRGVQRACLFGILCCVEVKESSGGNY